MGLIEMRGVRAPTLAKKSGWRLPTARLLAQLIAGCLRVTLLETSFISQLPPGWRDSCQRARAAAVLQHFLSLPAGSGWTLA